MADMTNTDTLKALFNHMFALGYKADSDMYTRNENGEVEKYSDTNEYGSWYGKDSNYEEFFSRMVTNAPAKFEVRWHKADSSDPDQTLEIVVPTKCDTHVVDDITWVTCERQINVFTFTFWHDLSGDVIRAWFDNHAPFAIKSFEETASRKRWQESLDATYLAVRLNTLVHILLSSIRHEESIRSSPQCFNETLRVHRQLAELQNLVLPPLKGVLVNKHAVDYGWRDY